MHPDDDDKPVMPLAAKPAPPLPRDLPGRTPRLTPVAGQVQPVVPSAALVEGAAPVTLSLEGIEGRIEQNLVKRASALVDSDPDRVVAVLRRWLAE
ncbi:hypothetical protein CSC3H3_17025 [Thalassospira marina]|uniref:Uncharacterized protein n=2 Tax=Thalassospira marina TaxID=2048283 RepID=A0ABM6QCE0_9PROT|nr:hypothetical protein CSC3H3_17025 [Thalassospira marina]